jgi:uncharacterized protein (TIGR03086 family)
LDATTAMNQTDEIVTSTISNLTADHREAATPCRDWTVHDVIEHMCQGGHMIADGLQDESPPENAPDFLADGPAKGWAETTAHMRSAATTEALSTTHQMPFGEVPGEVALSVIVADQLTHAWDLAQASGQQLAVSDELAGWAHETWKMVVPADGRTGDGFDAVVAIADDASALDKLVGYTGRQP